MTSEARVDLPTRPYAGRHGVSARRKVLACVAAGIAVGALMGVLVDADLAPLFGWSAAAVTYIAWTWAAVGRLDAEQTAAHAVREDPSRGTTEVLILGASVASLGAVGLALVKAASAHGVTKGLLVGLGVASVVLAWGLVHTVFTLRYAKLYYSGPDGGIDFNQDEAPRYVDFAYLAFTIGMTFQVSDTDLQTSDIRGTALRHALLSYLLGAVIIAMTINLVAGLSK